MDFKLPDIGEGVHEGEITRWLVKEGDHISADQPMVEVMTDKATVEIPSPVTGVVESLFAKEGQTIEVGKAILRIRENGAKSTSQAAPDFSKEELKESPKERPKENYKADKNVHSSSMKQVFAPSSSSMASVASKQIENEVVGFHVLATPATRKLARDLGVSLQKVKGTGSHGRVTKQDIQLHYEGVEASRPRSSHPTPPSSSMLPSAPAFSPATHLRKFPVQESGSQAIQRIPLRGIRKRISEAMAHSKRTAAHFTYVEEVDMSAIVKLRNQVKEEATARNAKLTFLPFIIKALIPALHEFPFLNSSLDDEHQEIVLKGNYNIGIATDTEQGLIVPVIKDADRKNIWELAHEIQELSNKARSSKLSIQDLQGGTFTITNAGSIGGVFATPVINHPEVAILGVNSIRKRPIVIPDSEGQDEIVIRNMMFLSLSVDHRVVDGADAARFMNRLVYFLSDPVRFVFA